MKLILLVLVYSSVLFANNAYDSIKALYISMDGAEYKKINYFYFFKHKKEVQHFSIKYELNKKVLANKSYYLTIVAQQNALINSNVQLIKNHHIEAYRLDKNSPETLLFEYQYEKPQRPSFRSDVITTFEYDNLLPYENILYGISFGIIFCAFLYYLMLSVGTKEKAFVYYSLMQLCVLLTLICFVYISFRPTISYETQLITDVVETLSFLFSLLFAQEILKTKERLVFFYHLFNLLILLNVLDVFAIFVTGESILYSFIPFYLTFLIICISGIIAVLKGDNEAIIYAVGWFLVAMVLFIMRYNVFTISEIYVIHIVAPLESLIFSFALALRLKKIVTEKNEKEKLLIHKSKLASMGEMIDNIAHQWRQPLMHLGYINMNLELSSEEESFDKNYFITKIKEANQQIKFMSNTLDNFRDFYKINKQREFFYVSKACEQAVNIVQPFFVKRNIHFELKVDDDAQVYAYENEYAQVILNFLTNSMDVFESRHTHAPSIVISIQKVKGRVITTVTDNAGGINENYLDEIFEPYFTTKQRGTGIGLYMSKMIIQSHFEGNIDVYNTPEGACFSIGVKAI